MRRFRGRTGRLLGVLGIVIYASSFFWGPYPEEAFTARWALRLVILIVVLLAAWLAIRWFRLRRLRARLHRTTDAWRPFRVRCEHCGYDITDLKPIEATFSGLTLVRVVCPECGNGQGTGAPAVERPCPSSEPGRHAGASRDQSY